MSYSIQRAREDSKKGKEGVVGEGGGQSIKKETLGIELHTHNFVISCQFHIL